MPLVTNSEQHWGLCVLSLGRWVGLGLLWDWTYPICYSCSYLVALSHKLGAPQDPWLG